MGSSGGRSSRTRTVIRTANTASENALSRSGVLLACSTAVAPFLDRHLPSSSGFGFLDPSDRLDLTTVHPQHRAAGDTMNAITSAISSSPKQLMPACLRNCHLASLRVISLEDVAQEIADAFCDLAGMSFQGEVAGVEEADDRAGNVAPERLGTRR